MATLCWRLALVNLLFAANIYPSLTDLKYARLKRDNEPCESFKPVQLNSSYPSLRISERKCLEYIIRVENHIQKEKWTEICNHNTRKKRNNEKSLQIPHPYVTSGRAAPIDEFSHMGAIGWRAKDPSVKWLFKCGSTLISEKFLLTAAHCSELPLGGVPEVIQAQPEIVRLGNTDISNDEFLGRRFTDMTIKRFIKNPKYASPKQYYDIALIELHEEVKFIKNLHPACIWPEYDFSKLGNKVLLTGWGKTEHGYLSEILQVATVSVVETSVCEQLLRPYRNRNWHGFQNHQICAGELAGGADTCQGDSGGPIQIEMPLKWNEGKTYWILGVTSFGINCGYVNRPGIYTRAYSFIDWIEEVVWESTK